MIRVIDLDRSIQFYCDVFNMKLFRKKEFPSGKFTLAFLGYGSEEENTVIELTYNWGNPQYELGTRFGHFAIGVPDVVKACIDIKAKGGKIVREPGPMKHGTTFLAFVEDPDGYKIELLERE